MYMNKRFLVLAAVVFTVVASGCTGETPNTESPENQQENTPPEGNDTETASGSAEVDRTVTVSGGNFYFKPDRINASVNETIKFVFENDGGTHDMRIPELGAGTDVISGGETQSFTVTFDEEGSYRFICSVGNHAERGMTGTIEVS